MPSPFLFLKHTLTSLNEQVLWNKSWNTWNNSFQLILSLAAGVSFTDVCTILLYLFNVHPILWCNSSIFQTMLHYMLEWITYWPIILSFGVNMYFRNYLEMACAISIVFPDVSVHNWKRWIWQVLLQYDKFLYEFFHSFL